MENSMFSDIFLDQETVKSTKNFVTIIIRRPHAYRFVPKYPEIAANKPIKVTHFPSVVILDKNAKFIDAFFVSECVGSDLESIWKSKEEAISNFAALLNKYK